jgi:rhodanese-related sulfurtransferase
VAYLAQSGHDVVNLDGGMLDWEAAGRPMVSETGAVPQVV